MMKNRIMMGSRSVVTVMVIVGLMPGITEAATSRQEPQCVVTATTQVESAYSDGSESVTRTSIPFRWVEGSTASGFARAEALLPEGGRAQLQLAPGYGMKFHTLTLTSSQGKTAQVKTSTPWYPLQVKSSHGNADWTIGYSSVSTSLELRNDTTCSPGQSISCTIRKVSAECSFNPLVYQESE